MQKSKGFTIIELIVVIAIIAVLAAIVLVNVTQYITKGKNSAIEGNLTSLLTNAAAYYDATSTFAGFENNIITGCGISTTAGPIYTAIKNAGSTLVCEVNSNTGTVGSTWCGCALLNVTTGVQAGTVFCVDSTGVKKTSAAGTTCATVCPSGDAVCK
jgi:prepilin-type N-terminal cleavage/methylation domain-containing protein